jgi:hypothetical protein
MNLSHHAPPNFTDPTWIDEYIAKMGENEFWEYKNKVYDLLDTLDVGCTLPIAAWAEVWNYDLFVKIACFYISESECCYQINKEHTIIKRNFDAKEVEATFELFRQTRREKINGGDGNGSKSESPGTTPVPAPKPSVQCAA